MDKEKRHPALGFKVLHELYLMLMDIPQSECIHSTFLCVKAYRDTLDRTDIVHGALLIKVGKFYGP